MLLSKASESAPQPAPYPLFLLSWPPPSSPLLQVIFVNSNYPQPHPTLLNILTQLGEMGHYRPCDLCENDPQKKKGLSQAFNPSKWWLLPGSVNSSLLPSVHFSSQDTSSLSLPLPCSPSTSLSSLVV